MYLELLIQKGVYLLAAHIPGNHNLTADVASLEFKGTHE